MFLAVAIVLFLLTILDLLSFVLVVSMIQDLRKEVKRVAKDKSNDDKAPNTGSNTDKKRDDKATATGKPVDPNRPHTDK
jgi:hypothetical protein